MKGRAYAFTIYILVVLTFKHIIDDVFVD